MDPAKPPREIYISYRSDDGLQPATLIYEKLQEDGYAVFMANEDLRKDDFGPALLKKIERAPYFVVVMTPNTLVASGKEDDWMRREIEHAFAIKEKKQIVPVWAVDSVPDYKSPEGQLLPAYIRDLLPLQGPSMPDDFIERAVEWLERLLKGVQKKEKKRLGEIYLIYRIEDGLRLATLIYEEFQERGYQVFTAHADLPRDKFHPALYERIESATDIVVVLTPKSLAECSKEDDWVRLEIAHALEKEKNIVLARASGFSFIGVQLPERIASLRLRQGPAIPDAFIPDGVTKLERLLDGVPNKGKKPPGKIFISYRSETGTYLAELIYKWLVSRRYEVFMDHKSLPSGPFDTALLGEIESCTDVIVVLTPESLVECSKADDWVRLEIAHALKHEKIDIDEKIKKINIVQARHHRFSFAGVSLPLEIERFPICQGLRVPKHFVPEAVEKLELYLDAGRKPIISQIVYETAAALVVIAAIVEFFFWPRPGSQAIASRHGPTNTAIVANTPTNGNDNTLASSGTNGEGNLATLNYPWSTNHNDAVEQREALQADRQATLAGQEALALNLPQVQAVDGLQDFLQTELSEGKAALADKTWVAASDHFSKVQELAKKLQALAAMTPPTISLTAPASGAVVSNSIDLAALAVPNPGGSGAAGVTFLVDGKPVNSASTNSYAFNWNTAAVTNGTHVISAVAWNMAGNQTNSAVATVMVQNTPPLTTRPTVSLTAPTADTTVSNTIILSATAADNPGGSGMASMTFLVDGVAVATNTSSPYTNAWDSASVANGSHVIIAQSQDLAGNQATSTGVMVMVQNPSPDTTPPTVFLTAPTAGTTVSNTVTLSATAADNPGGSGMASVTFLVDGVPVATDTSSPYTNAWNSVSVANGNHEITAQAQDLAGNQTNSAGVTVMVQNTSPDTTPPTVFLTAPTEGTTVSNTITLSATAEDNPGGSGMASVIFLVDGVLVATDTSSPYTNAWNTASLTNGSHMIIAQAQDQAGNQTNSAPVTVNVQNSPVAPNLNAMVGEWNFSEGSGTTVSDLSGFGNYGSLSNGVTWVSAFPGSPTNSGLDFSGQGTFVRVPASPSLAVTNAVSICAWVNLSPNGPWQTIVEKLAAEGSNTYPFCDYDLDAVAEANGFNARMAVTTGGNFVYIDSAHVMSYGAWHQLVGVYDGASLTIYVDGVAEGSVANTGTVQSSGQALYFGCNGALGDGCNGALELVRIYNRALTAAEVQPLYNTTRNTMLAPSGVRVLQ